jgi:hypothetical protein
MIKRIPLSKDPPGKFNRWRVIVYNGGCTVSQVNKSIKAAKAILTYAFDSEYVTSNVMHRFPKMQRVDGERTINRGVFREAELQALFANATGFELALFGTLSVSGPRPGEIYALDWSAVCLDAEKPYFRIERTWCSKGFRFYPPKQKPAGAPSLSRAGSPPSSANTAPARMEWVWSFRVRPAPRSTRRTCANAFGCRCSSAPLFATAICIRCAGHSSAWRARVVRPPSTFRAS